jgi:4-hydroxysphinganine ceramide fatty acyl 2-hydroxylase
VIPFFSFSAFALGATSWTLAEYSLHRFFGHAKKQRRSEGAPGLLDGDFGSEHQAHHRDTRYFTPTRRKLQTAAVVLPVFGAVASIVVGPRRACSFVLGFGLCYAGYEVAHRRTHTHAPTGPYSRWTRRNHLSHHFSNPHSNHGVTTPIWDWVFGTHQDPGVIRVPQRHAPRWLMDATGEAVDPKYAQDYVLAARAPAESQSAGTGT